MKELDHEKLSKVSGGTDEGGPYYIGNECLGCGACLDVCPCNAIIDEGEKFRIDRELCNGCGNCAQACPVRAPRPIGS